MAGYRRSRRGKWKCASGKRRFRDHREAVRALSGAMRFRIDDLQRGEATSRLERRTYFCARCQGWHLTSQEAPTDLAISS